ncbi:MAG: prolipoprotein diacylglyceryl transferase [Bacteroidales bacterium]|jgi:phosphatidylglycerol:prolipoprotein diacylglycerol transferase|nr:prolipoprotein diacylglyceryl transferase [Bacteroidales bacterium]
MIFGAITWEVAPEIISITESYGIRWYGVLFALGYLLAYLILTKLFTKEGLSLVILDKITLASIIGGVLGARFGHCVFYEPARYLADPLSILYIWEGGLASHGGAIGILIAFWIVSARNSISFSTLLSRAMLVVPLAAVFIRLGNLTNSEIYGIPTDLPWGFLFPNSINVVYSLESLEPRHPTQLYEALAYFITFIILQKYAWKTVKLGNQLSNRFISGVFLIGIFFTRFCIEFLKEPQVFFEKDMLLNMGQLLSIPFWLFGLILLLQYYKKK